MTKRLSDLINIGPKVEAGLIEIGIKTPAQLAKIGAVEAFLRMRLISPHWNNKMLLYALHGALIGLNCMYLPDEIKQDLARKINEDSNNSKNQNRQ